MSKGFGKTFTIGGHVQTFWNFFPAATQTAITTVLTGVAGYYGLSEVGIARAIFYAMGVFAFGTTCVFLWLRISQMISIFQRLSVQALYPAQAGLDPARTKVNGINVQAIIRNDSQQQMFYRLRRMTHSFERIGPTLPDTDGSVLPLSPNGGTATLNFGTVENVPFADKKKKIINGVFEMEIEYGSEIDSLPYLCHYKSDMAVGFNQVPNSKEFRFDGAGALKIYQHTRIK